MEKKPVGVIGFGSFGMTVSKLLSANKNVLVYARRQSVIEDINVNKKHQGYDINDNISASSDLAHVVNSCDLIFPVVPSSVFRSIIAEMSPYLQPYHILIHCTKGLDTSTITNEDLETGNFSKKDICTMSEIILQESNVVRVGCLSGPNLAKEILADLPAASVLASEFDEVIRLGQEALSSNKFSVFGSRDLKGAELAGAFKNIIALAAGILKGLELGKNMEALLITRGLKEMIEFGIALGLSGQAFIGTAGIGDLIATATSEKSRNFTFGYRFGKGENREDILNTSSEVVEGVRTLKIIYALAKQINVTLPIVNLLQKVIFEDLDALKGITFLMKSQYERDMDFSIIQQS